MMGMSSDQTYLIKEFIHTLQQVRFFSGMVGNVVEVLGHKMISNIKYTEECFYLICHQGGHGSSNLMMVEIHV